MSIGASWIGIYAAYFWWSDDWWHPQTITRTRIGIEDMFMCISHLGIGVFGYIFIFRKSVCPVFEIKLNTIFHLLKRFSLWFSLSFGLTWIMIAFFQLNSIISTIIGMVVAVVYILIKRKDLLASMFWSGIIFSSLSLPVYIVANILFSNAIHSIWYIKNLTGIMIIGIPIEDVVWYWLLGFFLGGAYPYLTKSSYVKNI